jgi:hypothetical protein
MPPLSGMTAAASTKTVTTAFASAIRNLEIL